jgi:hypothetical protein
MSFDDSNIGANVRRTKKEAIEKAVDKVSEVLGDGTRTDRYIQIYSDGTFDLTTHNLGAVQSKALPVLDDFDDEDTFHITADAIAEAIESANCPLLDSKNNEFIRRATPEELMDFWFDAPKGYIYVDILWPRTNRKKCYVQM